MLYVDSDVFSAITLTLFNIIYPKTSQHLNIHRLLIVAPLLDSFLNRFLKIDVFQQPGQTPYHKWKFRARNRGRLNRIWKTVPCWCQGTGQVSLGGSHEAGT